MDLIVGGVGEQADEEEAEEEEAEAGEDELDEAALNAMTVEQVKKIAREWGVVIKRGATKEGLIEGIFDAAGVA
jgi:hypothetical protein